MKRCSSPRVIYVWTVYWSVPPLSDLFLNKCRSVKEPFCSLLGSLIPTRGPEVDSSSFKTRTWSIVLAPFLAPDSFLFATAVINCQFWERGNLIALFPAWMEMSALRLITGMTHFFHTHSWEDVSLNSKLGRVDRLHFHIKQWNKSGAESCDSWPDLHTLVHLFFP